MIPRKYRYAGKRITRDMIESRNQRIYELLKEIERLKRASKSRR